jgi:hypothetical protein
MPPHPHRNHHEPVKPGTDQAQNLQKLDRPLHMRSESHQAPSAKAWWCLELARSLRPSPTLLQRLWTVISESGSKSQVAGSSYNLARVTADGRVTDAAAHPTGTLMHRLLQAVPHGRIKQCVIRARIIMPAVSLCCGAAVVLWLQPGLGDSGSCRAVLP